MKRLPKSDLEDDNALSLFRRVMAERTDVDQQTVKRRKMGSDTGLARDFVMTSLPEYYRSSSTASPQSRAIWLLEKGHLWPAYLVNFIPVATEEQYRAGQRDMWRIKPHPGVNNGNVVERTTMQTLVYRKDPKVAEYPLGLLAEIAPRSDPGTSKEAEPVSTSHSTTRSQYPSCRPYQLSEELYSSLTAVDQLTLLRPHMSAIIAETYAPAQWRNDLFYRGGQAREGLKSYIESGDVKSNEMTEVVMPKLERYIFSGGDRGRNGEGRGQGNKDIKYTPTGSTRWVKLSESDKRRYIDLVLRTEILIQHRIKDTGLPELAKAELERRHCPDQTGPRLDPDSAVPPVLVDTKSILAPRSTVKPPAAAAIPTTYLETITSSPPLRLDDRSSQAGSTPIPEWIPYALSLASLKESDQQAESRVWELVDLELQRCRKELLRQFKSGQSGQGKEMQSMAAENTEVKPSERSSRRRGRALMAGGNALQHARCQNSHAVPSVSGLPRTISW